MNYENTPGRLLRHALGVACYGKGRNGLPRWTQPYRNYYSTSSESRVWWEHLEGEGLAAHHPVDNYDGTFYVTPAGKAFALAGITYSNHHAARWGYGTPENP